MANKTRVGGTNHTIRTGRTMVAGTNYNVKLGKTCVSGTNYTIIVGITAYLTEGNFDSYNCVEIGSVTLTSAGRNYSVEVGDVIVLHVRSNAVGSQSGAIIYVNGTRVVNNHGSSSSYGTATYNYTVPSGEYSQIDISLVTSGNTNTMYLAIS